MVEEVEAHALYERTSALMRAAGSRRIPKLRSSPSNPTGWALSTQQSVQAMQSHKLTEDASSSDSTCSSVSSALLNSEKQCNSQKDNDGLSHVARQVHMGCPDADAEAQTPMVGREADMLNACACQAVDSLDRQTSLGKSAAAKAENAAEFGEAILLEERYHRAGREVMGQHVDQEALASAAAERAKQKYKSQYTRHLVYNTRCLLGIIVSALRTTGDWWTSCLPVSMIFVHHEPAIASLLFSSVG